MTTQTTKTATKIAKTKKKIGTWQGIYDSDITVRELDGCCGAAELYSLDFEPWMSVACVYENYRAVIFFTDAVAEGNGERLCNFIRRHKLGKVVTSPPAYNRNSGRDIRGWMWTPDVPKLDAWVKENIGEK